MQCSSISGRFRTWFSPPFNETPSQWTEHECHCWNQMGIAPHLAPAQQEWKPTWMWPTAARHAEHGAWHKNHPVCSSPRISIPFESASLYRAVPERLLKEDPVTCWFLGGVGSLQKPCKPANAQQKLWVSSILQHERNDRLNHSMLPWIACMAETCFVAKHTKWNCIVSHLFLNCLPGIYIYIYKYMSPHHITFHFPNLCKQWLVNISFTTYAMLSGTSLTSQLHQASKHREMVSQGWECILWRWALRPAKSDKAIADTSFSKAWAKSCLQQLPNKTLFVFTVIGRHAPDTFFFPLENPCGFKLRICQTRYG